jgi:hypothetical protein
MKYNTPEIDVIAFEAEDVISTSCINIDENEWA